jgi:hypothetical protein
MAQRGHPVRAEHACAIESHVQFVVVIRGACGITSTAKSAVPRYLILRLVLFDRIMNAHLNTAADQPTRIITTHGNRKTAYSRYMCYWVRRSRHYRASTLGIAPSK